MVAGKKKKKTELGQAFIFFFLSVVYEIQVTTKQHVFTDQYFPLPGMDLAFRNLSTFEDFWTTHDTSPWLQYINLKMQDKEINLNLHIINNVFIIFRLIRKKIHFLTLLFKWV